MIMSRKRQLFGWSVLFIVFILACVYLQHYVANYKVEDSIIGRYNQQDDNLRIYRTTLSNQNIHPSNTTMRITNKIPITTLTTIQLTTPIPMTTTNGPTKPKPCVPEMLVGAVYCNKTVPRMQEVVESLSIDYGGFVEKGGIFKPKDCIPINKLAIVIPYRNRSEHLRIFLRHMHPIMQRQMHNYRMIVVEQAGNYSFNRAQLINIGFLEALKISDFECFVFHDVDHILENDQNNYGCPESPKLLGVSVDRFHRRWPYKRYFGGVGAFSKEQFEKMNGYSNQFWGWGGEDDDAYNRIRAAGYSLTRAAANIGRYTMLKEYHVRDKPGGNRHMLLKTSIDRMYKDGLNSVEYKVLKITEFPLYTHILAKLNEKLDVTSANLTVTETTARSPI